MNRKFLTAVVSAALLSIVATRTAFPDDFAVQAGGLGVLINTFSTRSGINPINESGTMSGTNGQASASARANKGIVGASLIGSFIQSDPFNNGTTFNVGVTASSDEVIQVSGPPGSTTTTKVANHLSGHYYIC
jgi:hypothetical protein